MFQTECVRRELTSSVSKPTSAQVHSSTQKLKPETWESLWHLPFSPSPPFCKLLTSLVNSILKIVTDPPNVLPPPVTVKVLGGDLDSDLVLQQALEMRSIASTLPSYPTTYHSWIYLSVYWSCLCFQIIQRLRQTNSRCLQNTILFDLRLPPSWSYQ